MTRAHRPRSAAPKRRRLFRRSREERIRCARGFRRFAALFLPAFLFAGAVEGPLPPPDYAQLLAHSRQAFVVTTLGWGTASGTLRHYERVQGFWRESGPWIQVVVGKNGLAWDAAISPPNPDDPVKKEGDGRAPAGIFPIGIEFGFSSTPLGHLPAYMPITSATQCVDDPASHSYNQIVNSEPGAQADWTSSELMHEVPGYKIGATVSYNTARKPGAGSCIFLHVWTAQNQGTAGCTAMSESELRTLLAIVDKDKKPIFIQMPEANFHRLQKAWKLP